MLHTHVRALLILATNGRYVISGDSEGKLVIWDWKTTKLYKYELER